MEAPIAVEGLLKRYGDRTVVDSVSFEIGPGRVLALLGPNGAGKTTTVECVAGLRRPDAGVVRVLGADPIAEPDRVLPHLGMMLQEGGVHRSATPRELLRLFADLYPEPADVDSLIARLELAPRADDRVRTLSGGERQRVSLALALVGRPRVAILDEPTAGMDPAARRRVWEFVQELRANDVTVLLTTHAMEEAERLADEVAVLDAGRLLALDSPARLVRGTRTGLAVVTQADFSPDDLASALGVAVVAERPGRWLVHAGPERMADVTAWFAARGLSIESISSGDRSLEEVYLRLTEEGGRGTDEGGSP